MNIASCPWCDGKGKFIVPDISCESNFSMSIGVPIRVKYQTCLRCEGSGVIAFKALKNIEGEEVNGEAASSKETDKERT